jgi:hypothetical protein
LAATVPGAPAFLRLWNTNQIQQSRTSGGLGDFGLAARWSPEWLDGTLGFYYRNTTDITPQLVVTPGFLPTVPAAACSAIGGIPLGGTNCIINRAATSPADLSGSANSHVSAHLQRQHPHLRHGLSKQIVGLSVGAELVPREHAIGEPAVQVLPAASCPVPGSVAATTDLGHGTPGARRRGTA